MLALAFLQEAQLGRMRRIALALLLAMAGLLLLAHFLRHGPHAHAWGLLGAFAEAALVGGMADWFAVSALFRHPLGLPIPHTAIIPANKERIGESIGNFLQYNFMTHEVLREELTRVDFAGGAAAWLANGANRAALGLQLARALPALLRTIDEGSVRGFLREALARPAAALKLAPLLARLLDLLVAGRQHHVLLERILGLVARALEQHRPYIRQKVHENSPRWLPKAVDDKLFERILEGVQQILIEIQSEDSEWRVRFDLAAREMIDKLSASADYERKLHALLDQALDNEALRLWSAQLWTGIGQRLLDDAASPAPLMADHAARALDALATALQSHADVREPINDWLRGMLAGAIVDRRDVIAAVVWRVIRTWDAETVSRKFELQVGKDLQYIRINGTLVGGMIGVLLHVFTMALEG